MAICPLGHALAASSRVRLRELASHSLIMQRPGSSIRMELDRAFAQHGFQFKPAVEVFHYYTIIGLVEAGLGIGILPRMTALIMQRQKFRTLPIAAPKIFRQFGIALRHGESISPAATRFIDSFRSTVERMST
jgi:DNA-binding transcriptional LysR family regulator